MKSRLSVGFPIDDFIAAIGLVLLLVGTTTGSANTLLVLASVGLAFIFFGFRRHLNRRILYAMILAMLAAAVISSVASWF